MFTKYYLRTVPRLLVINRIRGRVALWRQGGYQGISKTTRSLLDYWMNPDREQKLFFCQIEAAETAIYITEVAEKYEDAWIENDIRLSNEDANALLCQALFRRGLPLSLG